MARIRTIKPEFPQSESMGRVTRDARLLFVQLWPHCDDAGRCRANPRMLARLLFPYDDDALKLIDGWLDELAREKCVQRYQVAGDSYIQVVNWLKHQKIDHPSKSTTPAPEEATKPRERSRKSREATTNPREDDTKPRAGLEGKGLDQGEEGKGEEAPPTLAAVDAWNEMAEETKLPKVQRLTTSRATALKARLSECGGIDGWRAAMSKIRDSPFLLGQLNSKTHPDWRADIEFILRENHFTKLMEGGYDRRDDATTGRNTSAGLTAGIIAAFPDLARKSPADRPGGTGGETPGDAGAVAAAGGLDGDEPALSRSAGRRTG